MKIRWFITRGTTACVCMDCVTKRDRDDIEVGRVDVWEEGSSGWLGLMTCDTCGRDMAVEVTA